MHLAKCKDAEVAVESVIILGWRGEFLGMQCSSQCGYLAAARVLGGGGCLFHWVGTLFWILLSAFLGGER